MTYLQIAEICHEANRILCEQNGDLSQRTWLHCPQWQKDSAVQGVKFRLNNPDDPISAQHASWKIDKEEAGWKYGPVKDEVLKTHPCLVPFSQLPPEQRAKDHLFVAIVLGLKDFVGKDGG